MEQGDLFQLDDVVALLERTPASLSQLLAGLPQPWLQTKESSESWSPYEVLCHLINGEDTNWMPRAQHILAGDGRPFEPFDRAPRLDEPHPPAADELLRRFAALRHANIAALRRLNLTAAELERTGEHPEFGQVTLRQLLATWAVHDLNHTGQIVATLARRYTTAVGPWKAYLSILHGAEWSGD